MKVIGKKCIHESAIEVVQGTYHVKLEIKKGEIVTLVVDTEDGDMQTFEGLTKKDQALLKKLPINENLKISNLLSEISFE